MRYIREHEALILWDVVSQSMTTPFTLHVDADYLHLWRVVLIFLVIVVPEGTKVKKDIFWRLVELQNDVFIFYYGAAPHPAVDIKRPLKKVAIANVVIPTSEVGSKMLPHEGEIFLLVILRRATALREWEF
ncbi:MAG: hypothetical protein QXO86_07765 [Nitrososphaerota archaeon]